MVESIARRCPWITKQLSFGHRVFHRNTRPNTTTQIEESTLEAAFVRLVPRTWVDETGHGHFFGTARTKTMQRPAEATFSGCNTLFFAHHSVASQSESSSARSSSLKIRSSDHDGSSDSFKRFCAEESKHKQQRPQGRKQLKQLAIILGPCF